jgi:hypothetical protein
MDSGLKLLCEQLTRMINSYLESIPESQAKHYRREQFHFTAAKLEISKIMLLSNSLDFNHRRLSELYDEQLKRIAELYGKGE